MMPAKRKGLEGRCGVTAPGTDALRETRQVIVFSMWTGSLDLIGAALSASGVPFCRRARTSAWIEARVEPPVCISKLLCFFKLRIAARTC